MTKKLMLTWHSLLIAADVIIILVFITLPQQDKVHGGLGQALMALYGLGLIVLLLVYEGVFLGLYLADRANGVRAMWWMLLSAHAVILLMVAAGILAG